MDLLIKNPDAIEEFSRGLCLRLSLHGKDTDMDEYRHGLLSPYLDIGGGNIPVEKYLAMAWEVESFTISKDTLGLESR